MATEVFTREEITLQDGTVVELRPLVVGKKRKFMRLWSDHIASVQETIKAATLAADAKGEEEADEDFDVKLDENELTERQYDTYLKLCAMCLDEYKAGKTEKQFVSYLEDTLDDPTIFKILEVSGGLDLTSSPN